MPTPSELWREWMFPAALAVGGAGLLAGLLMASGLFAPEATPLPPTTAAGGTVDAAPSAAPGTAAPDPGPSATASASASPAPPTDVLVLRSVASSLCLGVAAQANPDGAPAQQAACTGAADQQWRMSPAADGTLTLVNVGSGRCLDLNANSQDDGAAILQWSCSGAPNQQWRLQPAGQDAYSLVSVGSGKCVDVPGSSPDPGTSLQQWSCHGQPNQLWTSAG